MVTGEDRLIHSRHVVVNLHAFQSPPTHPCNINLCIRNEVAGARNVAVVNARRQTLHQDGTSHSVHGWISCA